jgi:hypothetical protein
MPHKQHKEKKEKTNKDLTELACKGKFTRDETVQLRMTRTGNLITLIIKTNPERVLCTFTTHHNTRIGVIEPENAYIEQNIIDIYRFLQQESILHKKGLVPITKIRCLEIYRQSRGTNG